MAAELLRGGRPGKKGGEDACNVELGERGKKALESATSSHDFGENELGRRERNGHAAGEREKRQACRGSRHFVPFEGEGKKKEKGKAAITST